MKHVNAVITEIVDETPTIKTFFLDTSFEFVPGQFVMVWVRGVDEIPMALSYENAITVQKVGEATSALFELDVCDSIGIRGPFGNGFDIKKGSSLIIAGGVGAAVLAPLAERLSEVTTLLGARTKDELLFRQRFEDAGVLKIATDDGSEGKQGYVTDLIDDVRSYSQVYCCGPEAMMKKVLDMVDPSIAQFSVQRYIRCGIGICGACCLNGLRVCKEGPVFSGRFLKNSEFGMYKRDECGRRVRIHNHHNP